MGKKHSFFLDSGAFSAYTKGVLINIDSYIQFIQENKEHIDIYANLDVIGDAENTFKNQIYIESKGLKPLPVYHLTSDYCFLERYISKGHDYIALGGLAAKLLTGDALLIELDFLFKTYFCNPDGSPKIKVHGFGLTSVDLMVRYPWYSVDSTSWVMASRFGGFFMPRLYKGEYKWLETPIKIDISHKSSSTKDFDSHYFNLNNSNKEVVYDYIQYMECKVGISEFDTDGKENIIEKGLCNDYMERDKLNIKYFIELQKHFPKYGEHKFKFMLKNNLF